jgi:hypothetical protein
MLSKVGSPAEGLLLALERLMAVELSLDSWPTPALQAVQLAVKLKRKPEVAARAVAEKWPLARIAEELR